MKRSVHPWLSRANLIRLVALLACLWWLRDTVAWALINAKWSIASPADCTGEGACWGFVGVWGERLVFGSYPAAERWRIALAGFLGVALAAAGFAMRARLGYASALGGAVIWWIAAAVLLKGGVAGLSAVDLDAFGGLLLTLTIALTAMIGSLVIGLVVAFARMSQRPVLRIFATLYIELWRGIPLITVLFLAVALFPLTMPFGAEPKRLVSVLVAFTLFYSAYMAEVFRAGLQSLPEGQAEAARALGLGKWTIRHLVLVPQCFRQMIPSIINVLIAVVKDTTVVLIIGMFDVLGIVQQILLNPSWSRLTYEGYVLVGVLVWAFCFTLSRLSRRLEAPAR
jgi:general L-amino acid transport system permease protein